MKPGLLDVNVLIALIDPEHITHEAAHRWFEDNQRYGWATCPITENGCVRILAKAYPSLGLTTQDIANILNRLRSLEGHCFWPEQNSILDANRFDLSTIKPKLLTDMYLLDVACANGGRLITFDRGIPWRSVTNAAKEDLEILNSEPT